MRIRKLLLFVTFVTSMFTFANNNPAYAGGIGGCGDNCPDYISICRGGPYAGLQCTDDAQCPKSECIESTFAEPPPWSRICKGGGLDNDGKQCLSREDCGTGLCVLEFIQTKPSVLKGDLTLIVDDQETPPDGEEPCGAAAVMLEIRQEGQPHFFSQLFRCIPAPENLTTDAEFLRTETELNDSADAASISLSNTVSILNRLLFRPSGGDVIEGLQNPPGGNMILALRKFIGEENNPLHPIPIVVNAKKTSKELEHDNHGGNDKLASVVRFEIQIRFVPLPQ